MRRPDCTHPLPFNAMTDIEAIRKALNEYPVFPPDWQDWARGIEDVLNELLVAIEARDEKISELENLPLKTGDGQP